MTFVKLNKNEIEPPKMIPKIYRRNSKVYMYIFNWIPFTDTFQKRVHSPRSNNSSDLHLSIIVMLGR